MENSSQIYNSLLPFLIMSVFFIACFMYFAAAWPSREKRPDILKRMHETFLGILFREFWYWMINPVVRLLIILKITPNAITIASVFVSIASAYLYYAGHIAGAGWLLILAGSMDILDGRVAREGGRMTDSGAFLDSCLDRFSDGFIFTGLSLYFFERYVSGYPGLGPGGAVVFAMMIISMLSISGTEIMSYVKAKGEAMGFTTKKGLMQRPERIVLLALASCLHPFFEILSAKYGWHPDIVLMFSVTFICLLIYYSALVRIIVIFNDIKRSRDI